MSVGDSLAQLPLDRCQHPPVARGHPLFPGEVDCAKPSTGMLLFYRSASRVDGGDQLKLLLIFEELFTVIDPAHGTVLAGEVPWSLQMPNNAAAAVETLTNPAAGNPPHTSTPNVRRRRLLVGAAGVIPSVYTLASGAQVSAASQMACFAKQQQTGSSPLGLMSDQRGTAPDRFISGSDTWFRSTAYSGNYEGHPAHCVTSPQNSCIDPLQPTQGETGSAWITGGGRLSTYDVRIVVGNGIQVTKVGQLPSMQGLVYVNENATIATLDPNGRTFLQPVSASCMASMIAGRTVNLG